MHVSHNFRYCSFLLNLKPTCCYSVKVTKPFVLIILGPTLFLLYINDLPDDVICDIAICADDTTLYSKCDQASDL